MGWLREVSPIQMTFDFALVEPVATVHPIMTPSHEAVWLRIEYKRTIALYTIEAPVFHLCSVGVMIEIGVKAWRLTQWGGRYQWRGSPRGDKPALVLTFPVKPVGLSANTVSTATFSLTELPVASPSARKDDPGS